MKKQLFILHMLFLPFICIPSSAADKPKNQTTLWEEAVEICPCFGSKTLELNAENIKTLNFDQIPETLNFDEIEISLTEISYEQLEKIFKKVPKNKTIKLYLSNLTITEELWDCILQNAKKISYLRISLLKNKDTDFTLAWPDLLKNSNDNLEITLYDNLNKKHLALQSLFTKLADNQLSNKNYTLNLHFDEESNINLSPTENKISSVKKLKLKKEPSIENVEKICKLFNPKKLKKITIETEETNENFLNDIKKNKNLVAISKEFNHLKFCSTSQQEEMNLYKSDGTLTKALADKEQKTDDAPKIKVIKNENTNKEQENTIQINQKWLTKKAVTYSALALGASYLTYRLLFAKSKQPAINLKKNLSDNPQKIFTFIPSQQKNQLAIGKLRNK